MFSLPEFGLLYCATGESYARLACVSIHSFFSEGGNSQVEVFTDQEGLDVFSRWEFDGEVIVRELTNPELGFIDKISAMQQTTFSRSIFVDCDTFFPNYAERNAGLLFQSGLLRSLESFDVVALPGFSLNSVSELRFGSGAIGQWNTGVIGFNKSQVFLDFLSRWKETYAPEDPHDQPSFRVALLESNLRLGPLMSGYNFQGHGFLDSKPLLFHLTGKYRKTWVGDASLIEKITRQMETESYPTFFIEFQKVSPLPSMLTRTLGPSLDFFFRGIWRWLFTRFHIFFSSSTYHRSL